MSNFSFVLLYVDDPPASARFYADLLGTPPVESSPTFAMLQLKTDVMLGLWSRRTVEPVASAPGGARSPSPSPMRPRWRACTPIGSSAVCRSRRRRRRWISVTPSWRSIRTDTVCASLRPLLPKGARSS